MKAALKSEFAILSTFMPAFAVILVPICAIMVFAIGNCISAVACVSAMVPMILTLSLTSYGDQNGWRRYRASLPFSRRDVIAARYGSILLASLATAACAAVLGIALDAILPSFIHDFETMPTIEIAAGSFTATFSVIVMVAIGEPFLVKFGATKGVRYLMCFAVLAGCVCFAIAGQALDPVLLEHFGTWADSHLSLLFVSLTVVSLALFAASCAISTAIYQRKDL